MRKADYRAYLTDKLKEKAVSDRLSRCHTVERTLGVDLDDEYRRDGGVALIEKLKYKNGPIPDGFVFKNPVNARQRFTDLRSAVKQYFRYLEENNL